MIRKQLLFAALMLGVNIASYGQYFSGTNTIALGDNGLNTALSSGAYLGTPAQAGHPNTSHSKYLLTIRRNYSSANHQFQISTSSTENDAVYFRKIYGDVNSKWYEFATRGRNTFTDTQTIEGGNLHVRGGNVNIDVAKYLNIGYGTDGSYKMRLYASTTSATLQYATRLHIYGDGTHMMTFRDNGCVGIGTTIPTHKLEVNGTIRTKEVKVEATNWPDYVFSTNHQLPSLQEVSDHITTHSHLPGIPSAAEVEENGVNMGEMQSKLLQKIEELTLYTIQQQSLIEELQVEVAKLKKGKRNR